MDELTTRALGLGKGNTGAAAPPGRYFLFVIAVDSYQPANGLRALQNPVKDANNIVKVLLDKYSFTRPETAPPFLDGYEEDEVIPYDTPELKCLYNEKANLDEIYAHLDLLAGDNGLTENDNLLVYFAGHGDNVDNNAIGYLMPFDADTGKKKTWLRCENLFEQFNNFLAKKKCRDLLLILDCCCAGVVTHGMKISDNATTFSRYALASASMHQQALDGKKGSPFANALYNILKKNTEPGFFIQEEKLQKEFDKQLEILSNEYKSGPIQHVQKIRYQPLKECGDSQFMFRLKDPDVPPVDQLSETFIKYLNFFEQRIDLATHYDEGGKKDLIIITTVCKNFNIHKLQGKVLFEELKVQQGFNFVFSSPIVVEPDKTGNDTWTALSNTLQIPPEHDIRQQCAIYICDRLLLDEETAQPLIIYLGYNFQSGNLSSMIIQFCKELQDELNKAKARVEYRQSSFNSLFLVIGDTRSGNNQFFSRPDFVSIMGEEPKVIISRPVGDLQKGFANRWHKDACAAGEGIKSRNFQKLNLDDYFGGKKSCDIETFILEISRQLGVNEMELTKKLWHF
ncbi:caspase family protein [Chitinophaga agrisoli]|uniref:Caspase family protein n=1 Tax=Chitinophaga agrisoli TaxID=2607653 RepID=A0A5B2VYD0_9BACT|nr:caspase family protein [Chitinophaga agrisoli]KAA2243560.1 caspase family protein [Chitinophaga agrisoli]